MKKYFMAFLVVIAACSWQGLEESVNPELANIRTKCVGKKYFRDESGREKNKDAYELIKIVADFSDNNSSGKSNMVYLKNLRTNEKQTSIMLFNDDCRIYEFVTEKEYLMEQKDKKIKEKAEADCIATETKKKKEIVKIRKELPSYGCKYLDKVFDGVELGDIFATNLYEAREQNPNSYIKCETGNLQFGYSKANVVFYIKKPEEEKRGMAFIIEDNDAFVRGLLSGDTFYPCTDRWQCLSIKLMSF